MSSTTAAQYSLNLRVRLDNVPGVLGSLASAIGDAGGNIFAIEGFVAKGPVLERNIVVNCANVEHQEKVLAAAEAGVDAVDCAMDALSGNTSQATLGSVVEALKHTDRDTGLSMDAVREISNYWEEVRGEYAAFETGMLTIPMDVVITAVAAGKLGSTDADDMFRVIPLVEGFESSASQARVRVLHAGADAPAVDIDVFNDATVDVPAAAFGRFADTGAAGVALPSGQALAIGIWAGGEYVFDSIELRELDD